MAANIQYLLMVLFIMPKIFAIDHSLIDAILPKPTQRLKSVQDFIEVPLESLYSYSESENDTASSLILSENCSQSYENFSASLIVFTTCTIKFARPIHICMECGESHADFEKAYQNLKKQGGECRQFYFSSDQLSIVDQVYNNGNDLWSKSYCQNCYDFYNTTEKFFHAANELMTCIQTTNKTDTVRENTTCVKCHDAYAKVSAYYKQFVHWKQEYVGGICMDVVDTMNISRRVWSEYNCAVPFNTTIGFPNILTALTVGATPVMFYLLAKNVSRLEDVKLVRPKRKFVTSQPPPQQ